MLLYNRVIYKDDAVYTDYTRELSDINAAAQAFSVVAADDALYIGSDLPFNHRWFNIPTANAVSGSVSVAIWDGSAWTPAVDVIDLTAVAGKPFAQDGIIMWTTDRNSGWAKESTTEDIAELASFKIYNSYWVKLTFSAAFSFSLNYVGHKFSKDSDLAAYYGDLNRATVREAFYETSTATWDSVFVTAAEEIIRDLRKDQVIISRNQILEPDVFKDASCHKMAEIVYSSYGPSHADRLDYAVDKYKEAMNKLSFNVDKNMDGKRNPDEKVKTFRLRRG